MSKSSAIIYYLFIYPVLKIKFGSIGFRTRIKKPLRIECAKNIHLGNKVFIGKYTWLAANPLTGESAMLDIGDGSYIGNFNHIYATNKIVIGSKVMTADKVYISDNIHSYEKIGLPIQDQAIKQLESVYIGDGAWIGENVCIVGASIGKGSVIGANSVVLKDIPDYCVAAGNPARIIRKYNFNTSRWE